MCEVDHNKRKYETIYCTENIDKLLLSNNYKIYNSYNNPLNCDKILLCDNHIYFDAIINQETIQTLVIYIESIIQNIVLIGSDKSIYIHINCKGGFTQYLFEFITYKKTCSIELISIIDKECIDCGIILAAICNFRIINKNAICKLSKYDSKNLYWNYFKQCNNNVESKRINDLLFVIICQVIESKITPEKLEKYFEKDCIWDAKKYKKLGLADEVV